MPVLGADVPVRTSGFKTTPRRGPATQYYRDPRGSADQLVKALQKVGYFVSHRKGTISACLRAGRGSRRINRRSNPIDRGRIGSEKLLSFVVAELGGNSVKGVIKLVEIAIQLVDRDVACEHRTIGAESLYRFQDKRADAVSGPIIIGSRLSLPRYRPDTPRQVPGPRPGRESPQSQNHHPGSAGPRSTHVPYSRRADHPELLASGRGLRPHPTSRQLPADMAITIRIDPPRDSGFNIRL
jgi:hypothetical protein